MFTGIVEEIGTVRSARAGAEGSRLEIGAGLASRLGEGESVSVEGVCLTATRIGPESFEADVMNQSLALTTLGRLEPGSRVNLEAPLAVGAPLGGHIVQGHVDGVGEVRSASADGFARRLRIAVPEGLCRYLVDRGSVAVSGVSLTVAALGDDWFEVSLIPETLERTTLADLGTGSPVNLEVDVLARYVERLLGFKEEGHR